MATWQHADVVIGDLATLLALRQHQRDGKRSPHKPLLALLALGKFASTGSSRVEWAEASTRLAQLIADYGPPSRIGAAQSAAYPFTRLRSDNIWLLDHDVPMDRVGPLHELQVVGQFSRSVEDALRDRSALGSVARALVESEFPPTLVPDVLSAAGLDPDEVLGRGTAVADPELTARRRNSSWPGRVLSAWDRQCAFCGFDGQLGSASVGIEAAHVRWFNFGGPDDMDNGLALCSLDHKLFDRGVLGLAEDLTITVSDAFTARTPAGRRIYELLGRNVTPRRGTQLPAARHVSWHAAQVFKGLPLIG